MLGFGLSLWSAPFDERIVFTQPDGTAVQLHGRGDEFYAVFETFDGYTVIFDPQIRAYCYATRANNGSLDSTGVQIHQSDPVALGLNSHIRMGADARKRQAMERWQRWEAGMQIEQQWRERKAAGRQFYEQRNRGAIELDDLEPSPPGFTTTGIKVGLTLLIDFVDDPATIPQAEILNYCNGDSYTGFSNNGSVKKYFQDNSGGLLIYSNVVTLYIRVPQPKTYYNDTTKDCGDQANILIKDALDTMKALPNYATEILPAFANLTVDGANRVVAFNVFYSGGNGGVWTYGLWPHSWSLYNVGAQALGNGKSVYEYQISNIGTSLELGTFCHENGHMLCGYPDIYDYDYDSVGGAGVFCLMNSGGHGTNPKQICAYLKRASGWGTTFELNSGSVLTATVGTTGTNFNRFYRYQKPGVSTEYYLVENRQKTGRDASLPAAGVTIWHVDELGDHNNQNTNYNTSHANYEVSLVQADNQFHFQRDVNSGDAYDLYHSGNTGPGYVNWFSDNTAPSARWWDGSSSGLTLKNFSASGETMTFDVGNSSFPEIIMQPVSQVVAVGDTAIFCVTATGGNPLVYQWSSSCGSLPDETNACLTISGATTNQSGCTYQVTITNTFGAATSAVVTLTVMPVLGLGESLDAPQLTWTTGGNASWFGQNTNTHDVTDAVQSGGIGHNQQSWLQTTVTGPGTASFWWKVSSELCCDPLTFYIDGISQADIRGAIDWQQRSFPIAAGLHTLRWTYSKDGSVVVGLDAGLVDQFSFIPTTGVLHHFTWGAIAATQQVNVPFPVVVTARDSLENTVTNFNGSVALTGWKGGSTTVFSANFDTGSDGFTQVSDPDASSNLWHRTGHRFVSPLNCQYYGLEGAWSYETGARNAGNLQSPVISLAGTTPPVTLSFKYLLQTESGTSWDQATLTISTNGGSTWITLTSRSSISNPLLSTTAFTNWSADISDYAAGNIVFRFNFDTIDTVGNTYEGWYLDDVVVTTSAMPVAISPVTSDPFINGVWTGNVAILETATNMLLAADDGATHKGNSNPFNVSAFVQPTIFWQYNAGAGTLELAWTGNDFHLQAQTNDLSTGVTTNWFDYPDGSNSPVVITLDPAQPSVFYRLVSP